MIKITNSHPIPKGQEQKKTRLRKSERQEAIGQLEVGQSFSLKTSMSSVSTLIWWAKRDGLIGNLRQKHIRMVFGFGELDETSLQSTTTKLEQISEGRGDVRRTSPSWRGASW